MLLTFAAHTLLLIDCITAPYSGCGQEECNGNSSQPQREVQSGFCVLKTPLPNFYNPLKRGAAALV